MFGRLGSLAHSRAARNRRHGFTLIELMIVTVIIGILAATAIPVYLRFVLRSKTAEAPMNLKALFQGARTYFGRSFTEPGWTATSVSRSRCIVSGVLDLGLTPDENKHVATDAQLDQFSPLDWGPSDGLYYNYLSVPNGSASCGLAQNELAYTFRAVGNLDGDDVDSLYELATGVTSNGLSHSGLYVDLSVSLE